MNNKKSLNTVCAGAIFLFLISVTFLVASEEIRPPAAAKKPNIIQIHEDKVTDNYFWLREKTNPEVIEYLNAENRYAEQMLAGTKELQEKLYQEMLSRIKETDLSVPYKKGAYFYYNRTIQGKQYPIYCRKKGSLEAAEEVLLDLNELAAGKQFMAVGDFDVSDDGNLLAYSTDETGFRVYNLFIKDLRTGKLLPDRVNDVGLVLLGYGQQDPFSHHQRFS